jgi:hypothetical protein
MMDATPGLARPGNHAASLRQVHEILPPTSPRLPMSGTREQMPTKSV